MDVSPFVQSGEVFKHSSTLNTPTTYLGFYKDVQAQLGDVLNIHKVHEAQIYRWKRILPNNREEIVTQSPPSLPKGIKLVRLSQDWQYFYFQESCL